MTHNPVYEGIPAPPAYTEHIDFGGNRDVVVNMDVSYHDTLGRKSVAVESLYDYVQWRQRYTVTADTLELYVATKALLTYVIKKFYTSSGECCSMLLV